jgi:hypothetical protein
MVAHGSDAALTSKPQASQQTTRRAAQGKTGPSAATDEGVRRHANRGTPLLTPKKLGLGSDNCSGGDGRPPRLETFPAEDGTVLRGTEGHRGLFAAVRASGRSFDLRGLVVNPVRRCSAQDRDPLQFAGFAAFGLVPELFIVEEKLFPGGKDKISSTVDAVQHLVLKFHLRMAPFSPFPQRIRGEGGGAEKYRLCTSPPQLPLDSARHTPERRVDTNYRA